MWVKRQEKPKQDGGFIPPLPPWPSSLCKCPCPPLHFALALQITSPWKFPWNLLLYCSFKGKFRCTTPSRLGHPPPNLAPSLVPRVLATRFSGRGIGCKLKLHPSARTYILWSSLDPSSFDTVYVLNALKFVSPARPSPLSSRL